jgi:hypothetical protein
MTVPLLAEIDIEPLQEIAEAGLMHEVTLETRGIVEGPGGTDVTTWVEETEQNGLLTPASAGGTNIRADQPSAAGEWMLAIKSGQAISEGQRAMVRGETKGIAWQRLVFVQKVLYPKPYELRRRALCIDVEANP